MVDWLSIAGNILLFLLVLGMSATVDMDCFRTQIRNKKALITGMMLQFVLLPFLGFLTVKMVPMSDNVGLMLLVVTSSPGGSYSNWWCSMFNADLALSVTMTGISTILSIVMLPINLTLYANLVYEDDVVKTLDWGGLFIAIAVVITAIVAGILCSARFHSHRFNLFANKLGNYAGIALVLFSAGIAFFGGDKNNNNNDNQNNASMWNRGWEFYIGVALPCFLALFFSNIITTLLQLKKPERVTASIECCYQNVGIATSVALTMFDGQDLVEAIGVPFYYGILEAVLIGIYCVGAWKAGWTKAPPDVSFWTMISTSYEIIFAERKELEAVEVSIGNEHDRENSSEAGDTLFHFFQWQQHTITDGNHEKKEPSGLPPTSFDPYDETEENNTHANVSNENGSSQRPHMNPTNSGAGEQELTTNYVRDTTVL